MKTAILTILCFLSFSVFAQTKSHRFNVSLGGSIQHYNGNLGNSFFQFKTTCFAGVTSNFGVYLNKSLDFNFSNSIGRFGYCPTDEDVERTASYGLECPGTSCANIAGMGNLRSQIVSSIVTIKYKLNNGSILPERSKLAPYLYSGMGINWLTDVMKRDCVNEGAHFSFNGGLGLTYQFHPRFNVSYNLDVACFAFDKVYATVPVQEEILIDDHHDHSHHDHHSSQPTSYNEALAQQLEKRKDFCLRNGISFGFSF